ncbi:hypothetical protein Y032_0564g3528 [Ancylostoma ceylanicum]|uniref:ATP-dependent DNA helicase n=1 Tax=Ancylostoma ceylanicum TaxID=53326 RepID=A0A016WPS0_9BILA|nr:hypothetical protein Y032_0564g3528 [Ancylostoma ceylanicum]
MLRVCCRGCTKNTGVSDAQNNHIDSLPVHIEEQQNVTFMAGQEEQAFAAERTPVALKQAIEGVDKVPLDVMRTDLTLGNKIMILGGDFRQVLPAVRKGERREVVAACITAVL